MWLSQNSQARMIDTSEREPRHDLAGSRLRSVAGDLSRQRNVGSVDDSIAGCQDTAGLDDRCGGVRTGRLRRLSDTRGTGQEQSIEYVKELRANVEFEAFSATQSECSAQAD